MKKGLLVMVCAMAMVACTSAPIMDLNDRTIPQTQAGETLSLEQVQAAIMKGSIQKGWVPSVVKPGLVEASIQVRTHQAVVSIPYTQGDYDIIYKSSQNLDESDGKIHRNYNRWVVNLSASIQEELLDEAY